MVKITLGTPNINNNFLSKPCLKNVILPRLPKKWKKATRIRAVLKSTKNKARGKKIVEEPNPTIVPIIPAAKAEIKNNTLIIYLFQLSAKFTDISAFLHSFSLFSGFLCFLRCCFLLCHKIISIYLILPDYFRKAIQVYKIAYIRKVKGVKIML